MFGANGIELCSIIEKELAGRKTEMGGGPPMQKYDFEEMLPIEAVRSSLLLFLPARTVSFVVQ